MSDDVKIYIGKKELNKVSGELPEVLEATLTNRANGNIDKAKALGSALAGLEPDGDSPLSLGLRQCLPPKLLVQDVLYQIKVLLVFACEAVLQINIPVSLLSTTAVAAMHSEIEDRSPVLYKNISGGAAFTFYYLALQKSDEAVSESIGEAFAMLCGVKNKDDFVAAGKLIWEKAVEIIEKEIEKAGFTL